MAATEAEDGPRLGLRDFQQLWWQGEASAVVEPHESTGTSPSGSRRSDESPVSSSRFTAAKSPLASL